MRKELPKVYDPVRWSRRSIRCGWTTAASRRTPTEEEAFFHCHASPNVTGQLHMGHAMDSTLQDILTASSGCRLFRPVASGTDHAGIATQIKVEERLREEEHLTRYDLAVRSFWSVSGPGRRSTATYRGAAEEDGRSCDWSRSRFTMDEGCSQAVREAFCELYDKGLIYKGSRIINWCPTADGAVRRRGGVYDKPGHLWHIRYRWPTAAAISWWPPPA